MAALTAACPAWHSASVWFGMLGGAREPSVNPPRTPPDQDSAQASQEAQLLELVLPTQAHGEAGVQELGGHVREAVQELLLWSSCLTTQAEHSQMLSAMGRTVRQE